jgi:acyloxyacyl hydrolase
MGACRVLLLVTLLALSYVNVNASGGATCAACTILVGMVERISLNLDVPVTTAISSICTDLSPKVDWIAEICDDALDLFASEIQADFTAGHNPDYSCINTLGLCKGYETCELYGVWPPPTPSPKQATGRRLLSKVESTLQDARHTLAMLVAGRENLFPSQQVGGDVADHLPLVDLDNDYYSTEKTLRGIHWRGMDCDDLDGRVYPGRSKDDIGPLGDHNCNGIYGVDSSLQSYEDKFCKGSGMRGIIALGDSATAHFHIPPDWLNALALNNDTFADVVPVAEDELDYPMCASSTGFENSTKCPKSDLPMDSIYLRLRARNQCNHRDYQNIGVNGGSSNNMKPPTGIIMSMKQRNMTDQPATVMYALIGNDVCGHNHDFDHMTTPAVFESNTLASLAYLDQTLVAGSHVILVGLVDGRVLYNTMHALQHPVGVTYTAIYDYLNCLQVSPCWGWMNANETVRNMTTQVAQTLNAVYPKIISQHKYNNFDMMYIDSIAMIDQVWAAWVAAGNNPADLIEPADGFHPSQTANALFAVNMWDQMVKVLPAAVGNINPNNDQITKVFGDQGGYYPA